MPDFECREHFLCWKLRARVEEVAEIQNRITEDVYLFRHSGEDVKNKFKDTRQWYLQLLGMSLSQLRQTMNTSDPDISADEFAVERIMKRVRPMSERYLERLVEDEFISQDDMDCIIVGGYNDVQEYFEDLNTNMAAVGSNLTDYDETDFTIQSDEGDESDHEEPDDTPEDELALERTWSHSNIAPPAPDIPTPERFNWADDVESELEMSEATEATANEPSTTTRTIITTITPLDEKNPSDPTSSDASEKDSASEPEAEPLESDNSSVEPAPCSPKSDQVEVSDSELELEPKSEAKAEPEGEVEIEAEETENELPSNDNVEEPDSPVVQVSLDILLSGDPDSTDRDVMMDTWVTEYGIPYWQWEMLFTIKLAAMRYKEEFEAARETYKVDPFRDVDWR